MRLLAAVLAASVLSLNAFAEGNDFQQTTDAALKAGTPETVIAALDREAYRGNLIAALELGLMYRDGRTAPRDFAKARKFLKFAASTNLNRIWFRHGLPEAQYALAVMLLKGSGGKPDAAAAESWFTEAAELGEAQAQLALAQLYFDGSGVKRDLERAFFWSSVAAASLADAPQKEAQRIRDQSQQQLEPRKLARAKTLLESWKAKRS